MEGWNLCLLGKTSTEVTHLVNAPELGWSRSVQATYQLVPSIFLLRNRVFLSKWSSSYIILRLELLREHRIIDGAHIGLDACHSTSQPLVLLLQRQINWLVSFIILKPSLLEHLEQGFGLLDAILIDHWLVIGSYRTGHCFVWLHLVFVVLEYTLRFTAVVLLRSIHWWVRLSLQILLSEVQVFLGVVWVLTHKVVIVVYTQLLENLSD